MKTLMLSATSPLPLVVFRICFGALMCISTIRFWLKGWIEALYLKPTFFFTYYGFEWVRPLPYPTIYWVFLIVGISALLVAIGLFYRVAIIAFFLSFTYIELIDKTNYLNHYYLVSLLSFLLIFTPANCYFSLDIFFKIKDKRTEIPYLSIFIIKFQLVLVYFFAGIAKINSDWLLEALPMRIWLPTKSDMPLIGEYLAFPFTAYLFSWAGMVFDVSISFLLWWRKISLIAYFFVIIFHLLTALLFPQIGMFPLMMIFFNLMFIISVNQALIFSTTKSLKTLNLKKTYVSSCGAPHALVVIIKKLEFLPLIPIINHQLQTINYKLFILYFIIQIFLPFRYLAYPSYLFWAEEGYRFSWRVMLIEKTGTIFFTVKNQTTGKEITINNSDFITPLQEKMMSTQPDMILQFAHFLAHTYQYSPSEKVQVFAKGYVSLNGKGSRLFIKENIDLATEKEGFTTKRWVTDYPDQE